MHGLPCMTRPIRYDTVGAVRVVVVNRFIVRILVDFDLTIEFEDGATVAFSEFLVDGTVVDEDNQFEGMRCCAALLGLLCAEAAYDDAGVLRLKIDGTDRIVAYPREEVESWEYCGADGSTVLCGPGGEIETWSAPTSVTVDPPTLGRLPAVGSTVVRLSTGIGAAVEFSDGTAMERDLPLGDGYLVLRESVTSSVPTTDGVVITLSSGYVLRAPSSR